MTTVKDNLIAARALLSDEKKFLEAYRNTGSAIAWAFDEVASTEVEVGEMFQAIGPYWTPYRGDHVILLGSIDRAIAAVEFKPADGSEDGGDWMYGDAGTEGYLL